VSNQTITVRVDPNDQPSSTGVQNSPTPLQSNKANNNKLLGVNPVIVAGAVSAGKQVFGAVTNNIGAYTGRTDIQRKINSGLSNARVIGQVGYVVLSSNPIGAAVAASALAVEASISVWQRYEERKLQEREAEYYRTIRGNRINESRYR